MFSSLFNIHKICYCTFKSIFLCCLTIYIIPNDKIIYVVHLFLDNGMQLFGFIFRSIFPQHLTKSIQMLFEARMLYFPPKQWLTRAAWVSFIFLPSKQFKCNSYRNRKKEIKRKKANFLLYFPLTTYPEHQLNERKLPRFFVLQMFLKAMLITGFSVFHVHVKQILCQSKETLSVKIFGNYFYV